MKKKTSFLIIVISFIFMRLSSQEILLGIKGGFVSSSINSSPDIQRKNVFATGFTFDYQIIKFLHFSSELNFEQRGFYVYNPTFLADYKCNVSYISLPLIAKLKFGNSINYFFNFGIAPAVLINNNRSLGLDGYYPIMTNQILVVDPTKYNNYNLFGLLGCGIEYKLSNKVSVLGELRTTRSFVSYQETGWFSDKYFNTVHFLIGIGYKIK